MRSQSPDSGRETEVEISRVVGPGTTHGSLQVAVARVPFESHPFPCL